MSNNPSTKLTQDAIAKSLRKTFGEEAIDALARSSGFMRRKRDITPLVLLGACISTLAISKVQWLADIHRTFNEMADKPVSYKPFHNQISKPAFAEFMRLTLEMMLQNLTMPVFESLPQHKLTMFQDIWIHDGSSFAIKHTLRDIFPGRFTKNSPAAVELHVTMSALEDNPISITMAPDKESEQTFAPSADGLKGKLLLADRGYESRDRFIAIQSADGFFVVRGKKSIRPTIVEAFDEQGKRVRYLEGKRFCMKVLPRHNVDMAIEWGKGSKIYRGRLVVLYRRDQRNNDQHMMLHTNLSHELFSIHEVGQLYRLRWQVELLFKEWKSYANLHQFDTSKAAIAEGLIWASLLAAVLKRFVAHAGERYLHIELSTQRVALAARHFIDDIIKCLIRGGHSLVRVLVRAFGYLRKNGRRAHPKRDKEKGRLSIGLQHIGCA